MSFEVAFGGGCVLCLFVFVYTHYCDLVEATMVQQPVTDTIVDTTCGTLLRELQHIWDEVGENEVERDKMLLQLEQECLEVYRRKVDAANHARTRLHETLASAEGEFSALFSALGEPAFSQREKRTGTLKDQVAAIGPQLEELRRRKAERARQFVEVKTKIAKICEEIAGTYGEVNVPDEKDLTLERLNDYHGQLEALQKEKSERLHKVLEDVNLMRQLCSVMGMDFFQLVTEVHPSLDDSQELPKSISNKTLDCLGKTIHSLQAEKRKRVAKIKELGTSMMELWSLMETPVEERQIFQHVTCLISASEDEISGPSSLSVETIEEAQIEVERLDVLKKSKMKELVMKKRMELEEVCKSAHLEPDANTAAEKLIAAIDSGTVDAAELLANLEEEIVTAKGEVASRKDIMNLMEKWMSACEEEGWLEDYNKDENRFNAKGAHLNLKRAEKARAAIAKLPAMVDLLTQRTKSWEEERGIPFMFDGVRLLSMLNEYKNLREEKEEEKRRLKNHKKVQEQMLTEKETLFGSRPSPAKPAPLSSKKAERGPRISNIGGNGHNPASRRLSMGDAIMQPPATPELSRNGSTNSRNPASNGNGKEMKRERTKPAAPVSNVAIEKEITSTDGGSAPTSPRL
ncbi:65-kDa microtubule-associated protein 1 isoform X1 [Physcomitrium patens]|uniref:Uncharacterized protein n=2 Tax=Physcomitrium patens TaxID=3218 RepID=A0A7I4E808_PHYPA|nr:65-kDa microtubule-associated protein 1-like isoform X1 [Physcomitrium patens]|eukprot:XP_024380460.1 65-kDa microtubule-associated protein 1-like isoform X1 [Physcomitrella patens]